MTEWCSELSEAVPIWGSAPSTKRMLLLAYPKTAWSKDVLESASLTSSLRKALQKLSSKWSIRFFVPTEEYPEYSVIAFYSHAPDGIETGVFNFSSMQELERSLKLFKNGLPPELPRQGLEREVLLICTHGRRDACCSKFGGEILKELEAANGKDLQVFESSHLGGHRFAPVMLHLPSGHMLGRLPLASAAKALDWFRADGCIPAKYYRGCIWMKTSYQLLQAALYYLRERGLPRSSSEYHLHAEGPDQIDFSGPADLMISLRTKQVTIAAPSSCRDLGEAASPKSFLAVDYITLRSGASETVVQVL